MNDANNASGSDRGGERCAPLVRCLIGHPVHLVTKIVSRHDIFDWIASGWEVIGNDPHDEHALLLWYSRRGYL